jgi:ATP-dependent Clp protease ATP-binding subunit ClpB
VVLIMTSNLPGDPLSFFKPEFINRVDDMIRFRALTEADLEHIVGIQVDRLRQRMADRRITLAVAPAALAWLAKEGYDPAFGARPLKRVIQRQIADPVATMILSGTVTDDATVTVDAAAEGLTITSAAM